jgi:hypothetical protein
MVNGVISNAGYASGNKEVPLRLSRRHFALKKSKVDLFFMKKY